MRFDRVGPLSHPLVWSGAAVLAAMLVGAGAAGVLAWQSAGQTEAVARALTGGDPTRAPDLITRYGCGGCHTIPGAPGADGMVGAPLGGLRQRVFVAGVLRNRPADLVRWIVDPQAVSPRSAMPKTGITESEARDVAAFLYMH
jgi:cytochrome c1